MPSRIRPFSFVGAGLAGGAVFLLVELVFLPVTKHLPVDWILRVIASLMAGPVTLTAPRTEIGAILAPAIGMHFAISILLGYLFCKIEDSFPFWSAILVSALLGLAVYLFNFHVMTHLFPWFATIRGVATLLAHVLYGVTTSLTHKGLQGLRLARPSVSTHA